MVDCITILLLLASALLPEVAVAGEWTSHNCTGLDSRDECGHGTCLTSSEINSNPVFLCKCDDAYLSKDGVCNYRQKMFGPTFLYSLFFGFVGADYFYLARGNFHYFLYGSMKAVTLGFFGLWQLIDIIRLLAGNLKDGNGKELFNDFDDAGYY
mmetsp:Transcript_18972/g.30857  ORF Transcript_18972/g.30857 Transcript_18972/m.30857 type:complete len:154 (+) Transcript_18972:82-543(+)